MSYDLCCWRPIRELEEAPQSIYQRLRQTAEEVDGLDWIPVAALKARFRQALPAMEDEGTELIWDGENGNVQVTWPVGSKPQHTLAVLVDCSWGLLEDSAVAEEIMQAVADLGCVLYDAQQGKLYEDPEFWSAE
jgi:hypothetical protein